MCRFHAEILRTLQLHRRDVSQSTTNAHLAHALMHPFSRILREIVAVSDVVWRTKSRRVKGTLDLYLPDVSKPATGRTSPFAFSMRNKCLQLRWRTYLAFHRHALALRRRRDSFPVDRSGALLPRWPFVNWLMVSDGQEPYGGQPECSVTQHHRSLSQGYLSTMRLASDIVLFSSIDLKLRRSRLHAVY